LHVNLLVSIISKKRDLRTIAQFRHALLRGTVITAKHPAALLQAMPDDVYTAMGTGGRKRVDRAFEAIKSIGFTQDHHLKRFIVLISASIAFSHKSLLC